MNTGKQEVNIPLLRKSVEWVEEQAALPEIDREWHQGHWFITKGTKATLLWRAGMTPQQHIAVLAHCGSAYCVAGKIAADHDPRYAVAEEVEGVHASVLAAELLGIDWYSSRLNGGLFAGRNTAVDIRRIAEKLAGEAL